MKFSLAALALAAAMQAQSINDIPACAIPCITASVGKTTSCDIKDLPCVCKPENFSKVRGDATSCVIGACGLQSVDVLDKTTKLCQAVGGK